MFAALTLDVMTLFALLVLVAGAAFALPSRALRAASQAPAVLCIVALAAAAACALGRAPLAVALTALPALGTALLLRARRPERTALGWLLTAGQMALTAVSLIAVTGWALALDAGPLAEGAFLATCVVAWLLLPIALVVIYQRWDVLGRIAWRRPHEPCQPRRGPAAPPVFIHVPTHSEPPGVVMATLDALAALDYERYEVLVIDNNTADPALWRPVEAHCAALGERFRFIHVEGLEGAKAGAMNLALAHTPAEAELIAVIDADYQAEPGFLCDLVGHFDDPRIAFVQTPHAYREWQHSRFQRACRWEYQMPYGSTLRTLNDAGLGICVGTMCIVRRSALEAVGGWSETCQTEDAELAMRLFAAGYTSVHVTRVYGRGLIPENWKGYSKQRRRWVVGPVQALLQHLPVIIGTRPSALRPMQRLHLLVVGELQLLACALLLAIQVLLPLAAGVSAPLALPGIVLALAPPALDWIVYRRVHGASVADTALAFLARFALTFTMLAGVVSALAGRPGRWHRTCKFRASSSGAAALAAVRYELVLSSALLAAVGVATVVSGPSWLLPALWLPLALQLIALVSAPLLALVAETDLRQRAGREPEPVSASRLAAVAS